MNDPFKVNRPASGGSGMVSTPHPLATQAGLETLRAGGNAVDAAIAANAVLAIVMPDQCGLGGDLFALVFSARDGQIFGLNGSGAAPGLASLDEFARRGIDAMPQLGPYSVTVPGVVDAWGEMQARFGSQPLERLLQTAARLAEDGFEIHAPLAGTMAAFGDLLAASEGTSEVFLEGGKPLKTGQRLIQKKVAGVLKTIGREGYRSFYEGRIAGEIAQSVQDLGGLLRTEDLKNHRSEWVEAIHTAYRGRQVYTLPPNSAGLLLLALTSKLDELSLKGIDYQSYEYIARCVDLVRQVSGDVQKWIADPRHSGEGWKSLLEEGFHESEGAGEPGDIKLKGDTIALCTADREGMGVSLIQSIYHDFGSGVFVDGAGFFLQNRGASFSLDALHPNCLAPGKRPGHTLTPALVLGNEGLEMLLGTRGGAGQPQTLVQVLSAMVDYGLDVQSALAGPRWIYGSTTSARRTDGLVLEGRFSPEIPAALEADGIPVTVTDDFSAGWMGCAQGIVVDRENRCYYGGADPRGGGLAAGY